MPRSLTVAWEEGNRGRQHSNDPPIIHRDLKSPNVLINSTWDAKVRVLEGLRVSLHVSACAHLCAFRASRELVGMGWIWALTDAGGGGGGRSPTWDCRS